MKTYGARGRAGCVEVRTVRQTGREVGVYHAEQAGMDNDPESPWVTVCETHHTLIAHPTLATARYHMSDPKGWCEECDEKPSEEVATEPLTEAFEAGAKSATRSP